MLQTGEPSDGLSPARRRRLLQIVFVFINLALVETHLPGPLWLAIGGIFWVALVGVTLAGSGLVCGTMCWIGAIQDIFEPFARSRVRLDAKVGRAVVLTLLVVWMPIGWLVLPDIARHDRMPIDFSLAWERHLFQFALAAATAASVGFLGKRGLCRYLCPFNAVVARLRTFGATPRLARVPATLTGTVCSGGCHGCGRAERQAPAPPFEG